MKKSKGSIESEISKSLLNGRRIILGGGLYLLRLIYCGT